MNQLKEINQTAQRYIILSASNQTLAKELLEWWWNE